LGSASTCKTGTYKLAQRRFKRTTSLILNQQRPTPSREYTVDPGSPLTPGVTPCSTDADRLRTELRHSMEKLTSSTSLDLNLQRTRMQVCAGRCPLT
jgi:hypothetical protein